ncbi:hypothetical protein PR202_gb24216 [Eleusine coracana subsp. coracana]|uniref:Uncharacterized protein n=1 Tax=Eleusine coracana subsp. coracana TaxID=191504 RepID=A0AAV5FI43_ELECO|nr:hypothetical protein PR202_gb24216 [Eleusine coracana subsp. coracana]
MGGVEAEWLGGAGPCTAIFSVHGEKDQRRRGCKSRRDGFPIPQPLPTAVEWVGVTRDGAGRAAEWWGGAVAGGSGERAAGTDRRRSIRPRKEELAPAMSFLVGRGRRSRRRRPGTAEWLGVTGDGTGQAA